MDALRQLTRFGIVGLLSNAVIYVAYLILVQVGIPFKIAMSIVYITGIFQTFIFNKRWTFESGKSSGSAFFKYAAVYAFGYVINLLALIIFVDVFEFPHYFVQAIMILFVAAIMFILQKYWVFSASPNNCDGVRPLT